MFEKTIVKQEKWKSKYFWIGVGGVVVTLLMHFGVIDAGQGDSINNVITAVASLLALFGVWNDAGNATEW